MLFFTRFLHPSSSIVATYRSLSHLAEAPSLLEFGKWPTTAPHSLSPSASFLREFPTAKSQLINSTRTKNNKKKGTDIAAKPTCLGSYLAHLKARNRSPTGSSHHRGALYEYACLEVLRQLGGSDAGIGFHALVARGGPGDGGVDLSGLWVNPSVARVGTNNSASNSDSSATAVVKLQAVMSTTTAISGAVVRSTEPRDIRSNALNVFVQCKNLSTPLSSSVVRELVGTYILATTSTSSCYRGLGTSLLQIDMNSLTDFSLAGSPDTMAIRPYAAGGTTSTVVVPTAALSTIMLLMSHTGLTREAEALLRGASVPLVFMRVPRPELLPGNGDSSREFNPRAYRLAGGAIDTIVSGPARRLLGTCGAGFVTPRGLIGKKVI
ncbi:Hypothetical protein, no similarity [Geotrichum candidum]|uniref:Required for respiratory growth protein 7, mitochondrial n=1 Tax=Geotrichum candidum TaxID=1173061 RepID=A0A0J9XGU2_GEOCN|nr:Hypothetical protein, no similarity [Geotrichum candidum]